MSAADGGREMGTTQNPRLDLGRLNRWLAVVFMTVCLAGLLLFNLSKPRIVVVFSGDAQAVSTQLMDKGMQQVLSANRMPVTVERQYLGVRATDASAASLRPIFVQAQQTIQIRKPSLLVLVDDGANLALGEMVSPGGTLPEGRILYVSINGDPKDFGYTDAQRVTGLAEHLPLGAVVRMLTDIGRSPGQRIGVIGLRSPTGGTAAQQVRSESWAPHRLVAEHFVEDEGQWRDAVQAMRGQIDVLLVVNVASLNANQLASAMTRKQLVDLVAWTQSQALTIGLTASFSDLGGALSLTPSREEQGIMAMKMALEWLDPRREGQAPPKPAVQQHFEVHVRQQALQDLGVQLPPIYLEAARASGHLLP